MSLWADYRRTLKMIEVEEIFDLVLYRPLAFVCVQILAPTDITPNQVTFAALVMGIAAGCCYAAGTPGAFLAGAACYLLFNVFDCTDGQLARLKKTGTHSGRIIDGIADYIAGIAAFAGVGIGFASKSGHAALWWTRLVVAGASTVLQSALVDYYRSRYLDYVLQRKNTFTEDLEDFRREYESMEGERGKWFDRTVIRIYLRYLRLQGSLADRKGPAKIFATTPDEYRRRNRLLLRLWLVIGPTSQITVMVVCTAIVRIDLFCWITIAGFNAIAFVAWMLQRRIDRSFDVVPS